MSVFYPENQKLIVHLSDKIQLLLEKIAFPVFTGMTLLPPSVVSSMLLFYIIVFSQTGTNTFRLSIIYSDPQSKILPIILGKIRFL